MSTTEHTIFLRPGSYSYLTPLKQAFPEPDPWAHDRVDDPEGPNIFYRSSFTEEEYRQQRQRGEK